MITERYDRPNDMNATKEISDHHVILAMKRYGGDFVSRLGDAAFYADAENLRLIKETWPVIWMRYADAAKCDLINFVAAELHRANFAEPSLAPPVDSGVIAGKPVFTHCNVCGCVLRGDSEFAMGMCMSCANEEVEL